MDMALLVEFDQLLQYASSVVAIAKEQIKDYFASTAFV